MHETQLNSLLLTWAGMLPMGNPTIISCNHLMEEMEEAPQGDIPLGITVLRFVTVDLAELYIKIMNGLQVHYANFYIHDFNKLTAEERESVLPRPAVRWHQSALRVSFNDQGSMKQMFRDNYPPLTVTKRSKHAKEKLGWFAWLPSDDYPNWVNKPKWTVNPYTGKAFTDHRVNNPDARPFLKVPHRSFWRAIGCFDNIMSGNIKSRDDGSWINDDERINAYRDENYFTATQGLNRVPSYTGATLRLPPSRGGRAASLRRPSRR